jgi:hypothetical protein
MNVIARACDNPLEAWEESEARDVLSRLVVLV